MFPPPPLSSGAGHSSPWVSSCCKTLLQLQIRGQACCWSMAASPSVPGRGLLSVLHVTGFKGCLEQTLGECYRSPPEGSTAAGERVGRDLFLQAQTQGAHPHRAPRQPITGEDSRGYGKALRATGQSWEHKSTLNLGAEHEPPSRATSPHPRCCRKNTFPTWGAAATRLPLCCFTSSWYNFISCRNRLIINARQLRSLPDPPPTPPPPHLRRC